MPKFVSPETYAARINARGNIEFVRWVEPFRGCATHALVRCKVDGYEWSVRAGSIVHTKRGCPKCSKVYRHTPQEYINRINETGNIEFIEWHGEWKGAVTRAVVRCKQCDRVWDTSTHSIVNAGTGCPVCCYRK